MWKGPDFILVQTISFIWGDARYTQNNSGAHVSKGESEILGMLHIKTCPIGRIQ